MTSPAWLCHVFFISHITHILLKIKNYYYCEFVSFVIFFKLLIFFIILPEVKVPGG